MESKQSVITTIQSHLSGSMRRLFDWPAELPAAMPASQAAYFLKQSSVRRYHVTITFDAPPTLLQATGYVRPMGGEQWLFTSDDRSLFRVFTPAEVYGLRRIGGTPADRSAPLAEVE